MKKSPQIVILLQALLNIHLQTKMKSNFPLKKELASPYGILTDALLQSLSTNIELGYGEIEDHQRKLADLKFQLKNTPWLLITQKSQLKNKVWVGKQALNNCVKSVKKQEALMKTLQMRVGN